MHKIDSYNRIYIMKRLPVRKRLSKPLASVATCASRQGNYRFRLANVFASRFLSSRFFIIKQFFCKINFMYNFQKTRISGYLDFCKTKEQVSLLSYKLLICVQQLQLDVCGFQHLQQLIQHCLHRYL